MLMAIHTHARLSKYKRQLPEAHAVSREMGLRRISHMCPSLFLAALEFKIR
jgi:hypothetical protein